MLAVDSVIIISCTSSNDTTYTREVFHARGVRCIFRSRLGEGVVCLVMRL